jgi:DNA topoisomerase-1
MIWKRAIASQCKSAQLRKAQVTTSSGNLLWLARGQVIEFYGYARYWNNLSKDSVLPLLQQGQSLTLDNAASEKKQTQPPPRYSEPKLVQMMEHKGIGRPSTYAPTVATPKKRDYVQLTKDSLQPTALGLEVDAFLQKALPDLLQAEFTAKMEDALDAIAFGKHSWQQYLSAWNQDYFVPALSFAKTLVAGAVSNNKASVERKFETSRTKCPVCSSLISKIPSTKVKKKYFLKCSSGCDHVVLFWSDLTKFWSAPQNKQSGAEQKPPTKVSSHPCPVCKKPLEEYSYTKDGQQKTMLRCFLLNLAKIRNTRMLFTLVQPKVGGVQNLGS